MAAPENINGIAVDSSNPAAGQLPPRAECRGSERCLHAHVHGSMVPKSGEAGPAKRPWMDDGYRRWGPSALWAEIRALRGRTLLTPATLASLRVLC